MKNDVAHFILFIAIFVLIFMSDFAVFTEIRILLTNNVLFLIIAAAMAMVILNKR